MICKKCTEDEEFLALIHQLVQLNRENHLLKIELNKYRESMDIHILNKSVNKFISMEQ
jgi:hypothetical protein